MSNQPKAFCSFCGKTEDEVTKLIAGPTVMICNECVALCQEIIAEDASALKPRLSAFVQVTVGVAVPVISAVVARRLARATRGQQSAVDAILSLLGTSATKDGAFQLNLSARASGPEPRSHGAVS